MKLVLHTPSQELGDAFEIELPEEGVCIQSHITGGKLVFHVDDQRVMRAIANMFLEGSTREFGEWSKIARSAAE